MKQHDHTKNQKTMLKKFQLFFLLFITSTTVFSQIIDPNLGIIPAPLSVEKQEGFFQINSQTALQFETESDQKVAQLFAILVKSQSGIDLVIAKNFINKPSSIISFNSAQAIESLNNQESYSLTIQDNQVKLNGSAKGVFYAMQTLSQLYLNSNKTGKLPQCIIKDEPRYAYRGLHLDVSRHFYPISFVKKYIDLMAFYKLNNFHWHLTDDQGWRIEI